MSLYPTSTSSVSSPTLISKSSWLKDPERGILLPADYGFTDGFDCLGRPQRVNLQTISSFYRDPANILAVDRLALPETNRMMPPFPHQRIIFKEAAKRQFLFLQMMRGGAKSSTLARFAIDYALTNPVPIIFTGPSFKQSLLMFDEVVRILVAEERNENGAVRLQAELIGDPKRNSIDALVRFANGASIRALPMGDGCLTADTWVLFDNRFGRISDCFTPSFAGKATATRESTVWTPTGFQPSDEAYANGLSDTIRVTTKRGYVIEGTANHGLRDVNGAWKRLDEVSLGDALTIDATPAWHNGAFAATEDECYALGALVGDGSVTSQYVASFATKDPELAQAVKAILPNLHPSKDGVHWTSNGKMEIRALRERFGLEQCSTRYKSFPESMLRASKSQVAAFIQGLFDTDGSIQYAPRKTTTASFANTSELLIRQLQTVLLHYGIASSVRRRDRSERWEVSYEILITGGDLIRFSHEIGFRLPRKKDILERAIAAKQRVRARSADTFSDTVVAIEAGQAPTFDIHVPGGNEYRANGFQSHNSKIRGYRGGLLIIDEGYQITEEMYRSHLAPFASVKMAGRRSKIIIATTSWYQDCYMYHRMMEIAAEVKDGNPAYGLLDFNLQDLHRSGFPLDESVWRDAKRHSDKHMFAMTYYNIWPRSTARWYTQPSIDEALSPAHGVQVEKGRGPNDDDAVYFAVIDLAASEKGDSTFAKVYRYENEQAKSVWAHEERGLGPNERAWLVHEIDRKFDPMFIVYDSHGAIGQDLRTVLSQKELLVNGVRHDVEPIIHHDANNLSGKRKLIPVSAADTMVRNALMGPRDGTSIRGEAGLLNLLHTKLRDLLAQQKFVGPAYGSDEIKGQYENTDYAIVDAIRTAYNQLSGVGLAKDKQGNQRYTSDGQLVFSTRPGLHDDGAYCLIYGVIGYYAVYNKLVRPDKRTRPRSAPITNSRRDPNQHEPPEYIQRIRIA